MKREVVFAYPCPGCRRMLQSPVQYLGRRVCCRYCDSVFVARDPQMESEVMMQPIDQWTPYNHTPKPKQSDQSRNPR